MSVVALTADDHGRSIDVRVGDTLSLTLAENPTTGFAWAVQSASERLTVVSSVFEHGPAATPGAGGQRQILVRATAAGAASLVVGYARPWAAGAEAARQITFTVSIR